MALVNGPYSDPNYLTRKYFAGPPNAAGANGTFWRFAMPFAGKLRNCIAVKSVVGTTSVHAITVFKGTDSVGSIALGSGGDVLDTATSGDLNLTCAAGDVISFKNLTDATGVSFVVAEVEMTPDATYRV